jgi:signal transduction histidine kinase
MGSWHVRSRRIHLGDQPPLLQRLLVRPATRYGIGVACAAVLVLFASLGEALSPSVRQAVFFAGVTLSAGLGGLGPGLTTTFLAAIVTRLVVTRLVGAHVLNDTQMVLILAEGSFLSLLGGMLMAARRSAREQLAVNLRLEKQILEISDDERRRIGHDLHDGLGQHLTGISLLSETMAQQLEAGRKVDAANVETITRLVSQAVGITRDLAKSLSPVTLEREGLLAAIQELAETSSSIFGITCTWSCDEQTLAVDRTRTLHLYRIVQEAVNNSVRHGKARNIQIGISTSGGRLKVSVSDDGSGLSHKTMTRPGLGLRIMQYRARMLGASIAVERASERGGTIVSCECPLNGEMPRS